MGTFIVHIHEIFPRSAAACLAFAMLLIRYMLPCFRVIPVCRFILVLVPLIHEAIWNALCQIAYRLKQQRARRIPVTVMERPVRPPGSVAPLTVNWDDPVDIEF